MALGDGLLGGNVWCAERAGEVGGGSANGAAMTFDQTTNRMTAYGGLALSYDAAGNLAYDQTGLDAYDHVTPHSYQWDAENRMVSAGGAYVAMIFIGMYAA